MFSHIKELFTRPSGYTIARSVRLRSSASAYFNRTPSTNGSQTTWTWSNWVKRGTLGTVQRIFNSVWGTTDDVIRFTASDTIDIYINNTSGGRLITSAVYRDPSAWYHIVVVWNSTNATSSDRLCLYVNGVRVTAFSTASYPTQNYTATGINSANSHMIGRYVAGSSEYFDGYLTEINFIDGQALTPSSFGETDSITGVWKAKKYSGTYGTNGFYLNFSDNSSNTATTIGKDYSGNGNNWTPNNISVTAGSTYDSMTDVPTLTSATAANFCTLNPLVPDTANPAATRTFADGNLKVTTTTTAGGQSDVYGTIGVSSGKWYYEGIRTGGNVDAFFGWSSARFQVYTAYYGGNGYKYTQSGSTAYGASWTTGDVIGVAYDADNNTMTFYKNGTSQGVITSALNSAYAPYFPVTFDGSGSLYADMVFNFGQRPFTYTPPTGYVALNTYNLPASTIKNGAAYMAATTYTGTGSAQNITNSGSFQPDFVWIKNRGGAYGHGLVDSVRGRASVLYSNDTAAQGTSGSTQDVTAFNSNGFALGTNSQIECNASGQSYIGWQWKAGGTSSSNTNGSITSTVSVGATQGFSVVTYTHNGTNAATVGHGLGVTPSFIINKQRSAVSNWRCYHVSLTAGYNIQLNLTQAQGIAADIYPTAPTSSVFTPGNGDSASGQTMVAYCFAAVAGYSAFGSYTGNGSTDGPFVFTNFQPRWIMIKRSDSGTEAWNIFDTSRDLYNVEGQYLQANSAGGEGTASTLDALSNGFKIRASGLYCNASGGTYIYACFASNPLKYANAR